MDLEDSCLAAIEECLNASKMAAEGILVTEDKISEYSKNLEVLRSLKYKEANLN